MSISVADLSAVRAGRTILHPISLHFDPSERIGLVGASGSGKSTLGHELVDRLRQIAVAVAHVPQSPDEALDPLRSLAFHWREAEAALGLPGDAVRRDALLKAMGIGDADLRQRPWRWSRGMQQRFVIAMALIGAPALLILDEPTSALDPVVAASAMTLLDRHLDTTGAALLLITHDTGWMRYARVARGIGLSLDQRGYVVQARLAGLPSMSIVRWHYLPALLPSLTVVWTGQFARAILGISTLGFLGFGVQPPTPEWGTMLLDARVHIRSTPLQMIWPGLAIVFCVLAINLAGDALRDALARMERAG